MALDLTGIGNENEFYTHHYLTVLLENDLKGLFTAWEEREAKEGVKAPHDRLARLHRDYFALRKEMERLRTNGEIIACQREFFPSLLESLGYLYEPALKELDSGSLFPVIGEVRRKNGAPELWIVETVAPLAEDPDPMDLPLTKAQYGDADVAQMHLEIPLSDLMTKHVFTQTEPPRWVLILSFSHLILLDRSKWNERRYLRFDLSEILGRRAPSTLRATAALVHRESVCPEEGISLLDTLDESSHKHAFAVSEDLKYSAREAVELLGNEAVFYIRQKRKESVFGDRGGEALDAAQLTLECLRYLYRLLFLFYIEARPELGYAPMNSEEYRTGYSLDALRDLELNLLSEESSRDGYFIHDSLQTLFRLIFEGFNYQRTTAALTFEEQRPVFRLYPLNSHLFDPARTPLLNGVKFRNGVLQKVIELLSLSRAGNGRHRRGRISYAQLGINQLGAVYEGLLSYTGFFAETDLYEVKKAGTEVNELEAAFFVNAEDFQQYEETERVYNTDGTLRIYPRGTFIYRLAGRNREKTASYYTPEDLTRCLVKYALKELLKDKTADDILKLTVCEPAMGSAAFLNEAINQLADAYLERKQKETGETIGHDDYGREKQKVKAFLADNNVFGVDLNPVAVELAEVSLWLNAIYVGSEGETPIIPWFGNQLICGNSLVGARRQIFDADLLEENRKGKETWLDVVPDRVSLGIPRPPKSVYHFLLPDAGMANYPDKVVREMAKKETEKIKEWRKDFIRPFNAGEIKTLQRLSDAVDKLWERHMAQSARIRFQTRTAYRFFGYDDGNIYKQTLTTKQKDDLFNRELLSENIAISSPFRRLKLVMDYWCSLWLWPIQKADTLPSRDEFLMDLTLIIEGTVYETVPAAGEQLSLLPDNRPTQQELDLANEFGHVNVDALCDSIERLAIVRDLAKKHHFQHWELIFSDIFAKHGGFDLVLGNPPWIRVRYEMQKILGDFDPKIILRNINAEEFNKRLFTELGKNKIFFNFSIEEYCDTVGIRNFISSKYYNNSLDTKSNLYKSFLEIGIFVANKEGISSLLHDAGIFDENDAQKFREWLLRRMIFFASFINQLNHFPEDSLGHAGQFVITVLKNKDEFNDFKCISYVLHPKTIDDSFISTENSPIPLLKDNKGWILKGHPLRIIDYNQELNSINRGIFSSLTGEVNAPILSIYAKPLISIMAKTIKHTNLSSLQTSFKARAIFDENAALKNGTIEKKDNIPIGYSSFIFSSPHFYIGTPFYKQPNANCKSKGDYSHIDLLEIPEDFLPRAIFRLTEKYSHKIFNNSETIEHLSKYRLAWRTWVSSTNERTLISCLIPPQTLTIYPVFSMTFPDYKDLTLFAGLTSTIIYDFLIRITGADHIWEHDLIRLPFPKEINQKISHEIIRITAELQCITNKYSDLWEDLFNGEKWHIENVALSQQQRRFKFIELEVLTAMMLDISLQELILLYRVQFPTLAQYEEGTYYDRNGRIIYTNNRNLNNVGVQKKEWEAISSIKNGEFKKTILLDENYKSPRERTITYVAPFDCCDREADYATAWAAFEKRGLK